MKIPIEYSLTKLGLPLIVTSSKPNLCFLIDTGATHNIVFSYVYEEIPQYFSALQDTSCLMGIEGTQQRTNQVEASISFDNRESIIPFSVMDANAAILQIQKESGIQIHGILGIPFLTQNKWILDFNNLSVQC
jgi:hypothetical protein